MINILSNLPRVGVCKGIFTSKFVKLFALIPACVFSCKFAACHGDKFCWLLTSGSPLRQWFEINDLLHEASIRGGGVGVLLQAPFWLEWNWEWCRVPYAFRNFRVVLAKYEVWIFYVHWMCMCRKWSLWKPRSGLVRSLRFGPRYVHFCVFSWTATNNYQLTRAPFSFKCSLSFAM